MAIGDVIRVAFEGRAGYGDLLVTTLHFRVITSTLVGFQEEMQELLTGIESDVMPDFLATMNNVSTLDRIVARSVEGPPIGTEVLVGTTGSRTGDPLPQQLSAEILWRSALLGRRYSGRQKMWPAVEGDIAAATWTSGYRTSLTTYAESASTLISTSDASFQLTVYSKKFGFDNLVTVFKQPQLIQIFRIIAKNPPRPEMGYELKTNKYGAYVANFKLGPSREGGLQ